MRRCVGGLKYLPAVHAPEYSPPPEKGGMEQDDAMDWGLWMPIICGLAAGAACCSLTVVFYCWCAMRDQFSSLSSLSTSSNFNFRGAFEQSRGPLRESPISQARAHAGRHASTQGAGFLELTPISGVEYEATRWRSDSAASSAAVTLRQSSDLSRGRPFAARIQTHKDGSADVFV